MDLTSQDKLQPPNPYETPAAIPAQDPVAITPVPTATLPELSPQTRRLLEGPVFITLVQLAAPTVAQMAFQGVVSAGETSYVGRLGPSALAGVSLSFPMLMLMTTLAAGAYGGGVSSGVARALGAGKMEDASRVAGTALFLAALMGLLTTIVMLLMGNRFYAALGASGAALEAATQYSHILFLGAIPFWVLTAAASILRGSGNTAYPAIVGAIGGAITLLISPLLIFGLGSFPGVGIAGAAGAIVAYNTVVAILLLRSLWSPASATRPTLAMLKPHWQHAKEILRVSIPSAANTLVTNLTFIVLIALVAPLEPFATAGYGAGGRLEFLMIPLVFGIGSAIIPLVAINEAAGKRKRVQQIIQAGALLSASACGLAGLFVTIFPHLWMMLFTTDVEVMAIGEAYLRRVAPAYPFFGVGLSLFFAAQGLGRVLQPLVATLTRLVVAGIGGIVAVRLLGLGLNSVFVLMGVGLVMYSLVMSFVMRKEIGLT